jgi:hypothetical protein
VPLVVTDEAALAVVGAAADAALPVVGATVGEIPGAFVGAGVLVADAPPQAARSAAPAPAAAIARKRLRENPVRIVPDRY